MDDMTKTRVIAASTAVAVFATLTACGAGKVTEPFKDAPRGAINGEPADIFRMPDGFSNFAAKCDGTTRVYVLFKGDSAYGGIAVSPNHPACGGAG